MAQGVTVGSLDLALRLPAALRSESAGLERGAREGLVPGALAAMERRLAAIYGEEAVVRIRRLDLQLRIAPGELASPALIATLADDLAAHVRASAIRPQPRALSIAGDAPVMVFADAAQWLAVRLVAAAARRIGPEGRREEPAALLAEVASRPDLVAAGVLVQLEEAGCLAAVVAALPRKALQTLLNRVSARLPPHVRLAAEAASHETSGAQADWPSRPASQGTAGSRIAPMPAGETGRSDEGHDAPEAPAKLAAPNASGTQQPAQRPAAELAAQSAPPPPVAQTAPDPVMADVRHTATDQVSGTASSAAMPPRQQPPPGEPPPPPLADPEAPEPSGDIRHPSGWCGLAYLVTLALRCELPERLWQIGLDEGAVLALALGQIAGEDDPAWQVLCSRFPQPPQPPAHTPDWAMAELCEAALTAGARLLGGDAARAALETAVQLCLARTGHRADEAAGWQVRWVAAFLEALLALLLDIAPGSPALQARLALRGTVRLEDGVIWIVQPIEQIDLGIRRAGLDADPGWLAWRSCTLKLLFVGDEAAG